MAILTRSPARLRLPRWALPLSSVLLLLACAGDETTNTDAVALTGDDGATASEVSGPTCGGQVVPSGDDDLAFTGYSGDLAFKVQDWTVQQFNLVTGASKDLFSIDNHDDGVINAYVADDQDVFAVTDYELYRFDRAAGQLSLVSRAPDASVDPSLGTTKFAQHLDLSSTHVLTQPYETQMTDSGDPQLRVYLGLFARPSGELDLLPVGSRPNFLSYAGDVLYFVEQVADSPDPMLAKRHLELSTYDPQTDGATLIASGFEHYAFIGDTLWYTQRSSAPSSAASSFSLYRVPSASGAPELVQDGLARAEFVTNGTKLYLMEPDPTSAIPALTELDTTSNTSRALGNCDGLVVHASDSAAYLFEYNASSVQMVRVPL